MHKLLLSVIAIFAITSCSNVKPKEDLIWQADFEQGDLSQWSGLIFDHGLSVQDECTYSGKRAGQVTLTGDDHFVWRGRSHLNRAEFKYQPPAEATAAGNDTYFGFSFYLPEAFTESRHELGYWESENSWQQMFRFNIVGTEFSFQSSREQQPRWRKPAFAEPGQWRDVAMHVHWSTDSSDGFVDVWLDGVRQQREYLPTLANNEHAMFVQLGILRDQQPVMERIFIDNARHGESIQAVLAEFNPQQQRPCQQLPKPEVGPVR